MRKSYFILPVIAIGVFVCAGFIVRYSGQDKKSLPTSVDLTEQRIATLDDWKKKYPGIKSYTYKSDIQNLPANLVHPGIITNEPFTFPEDGWYIGFVPEQTGAHHVLHHADIIDTTAPNYFCTNGMPNVITATGEELNEGFLPVGYGYEVSKNSQMLASIMYHNESAEPLAGVRTEFTFYYLPEGKGELKSAVPFFFDVVGPCKWGSYTVPPDNRHIQTMEPEYTVEKPGRIISMGIHMHHYAESFAFSLNGETVKTFTLDDSEEGKELHFPVFVPKNLRIEKGDRLGITAVYDNKSGKELDAMAEALFFFVPD